MSTRDPSDLDSSSLKQSYIYFTTHITPGPRSWSYFLPVIILPASLLFPSRILPKKALTWVVFPISLGCSLHAMRAMGGFGDVICIDTVWWGWFFLVGRDVRRQFARRMMREGEVWKYPEHGGLWERARWVGMLVSERPLACWEFGGGDGAEGAGERKVAVKPYIVQSRRKFVKDVLVVLLPAVGFWMPLALQLRIAERYFPLWTGLGSASTPTDAQRWTPFPLLFPSRLSIPLLLHNALPASLLRPLTLGIYLYALLTLLFLPTYLLPVLVSFLLSPSPAGGAIHTWSPHLWPRPHFGPFSAVLDQGLQGLWGKWWHQQMRHAVSEPGRVIARTLGLRRGGMVGYAVTCASAFALSGITHMGLVPPEPLGREGRTAWESRARVGAFFAVQPLGILVELIVVERGFAIVKVLSGGGRTGRVALRALRMGWVVLFMSFALRFLIVPFEELGFWKIWPPSFLGQWVGTVLKGNWMI